MRKANRAYRKYKKQRRKVVEQEMHDRDRWVTKRYGDHGHSACGKKQRYETKVQAESVVARALSKDCQKTDLKVYQCPFCSGWHISHASADTEFWDRYVSHAQMHLQRQLEKLEPNKAKAIDLDYTKTKSLTKLREWDMAHMPAELLPYPMHRHMKTSRKIRKAKRIEVDLEEIIAQEGIVL